jgi:hypothetical protein
VDQKRLGHLVVHRDVPALGEARGDLGVADGLAAEGRDPRVPGPEPRIEDEFQLFGREAFEEQRAAVEGEAQG